MKNPINVVNHLKTEFLSYISAEYQIDDPVYQEQIEKQIQKFDLFAGPFLKSTLPFRRSKSDTISSHVKEGSLHPDFLKLNLPLERPLYQHQASALKIVQSGRNAIITTGTGSGKTESFLYPILDWIMKLKETTADSCGVKAIILYPMNALVNDQLDRFRSILKEYPLITYGKYTGEVQESLGRESISSREYPVNELRDRVHLRQTPPDILITNYSMLEYLLLRPKDSAIINPETLRNW